MSERMIARMLAPLARRLGNLLARGTVVLAKSTTKMQTLQVKLLSGEVKDGVEHFESYGLTAHPKSGAEHITLFMGGDRSHGVTIMVADRRHRPTDLAEGEVALYDDLGHKVHLTRTGIVIHGAGQQITLMDTPKVRMECDLDVTGQIKDQCDSAYGRTMGQMRATYTGHTHNETGSVTAGPNQAV